MCIFIFKLSSNLFVFKFGLNVACGVLTTLMELDFHSRLHESRAGRRKGSSEPPSEPQHKPGRSNSLLRQVAAPRGDGPLGPGPPSPLRHPQVLAHHILLDRPLRNHSGNQNGSAEASDLPWFLSAERELCRAAERPIPPSPQ